MTLKEIKNQILKKKNKLEFKLKQKQINYNKTQNITSKIKEIVVFNGFKQFDAFTSYMIKDEDLDNEIYSLQEEILNLQLLLIKEIKRMKEYDQLPLIIYLREEEDWSWKDIDKFFVVSDDVSRVRYSRFKSVKKIK